MKTKWMKHKAEVLLPQAVVLLPQAVVLLDGENNNGGSFGPLPLRSSA
jgi:hypothetical protein